MTSRSGGLPPSGRPPPPGPAPASKSLPPQERIEGTALPVSPYDETRVGLAHVELGMLSARAAAPPVSGATMVEAFDRSALDLSDLPSMSADELGGFSTEGQTLVSPPLQLPQPESALAAAPQRGPGPTDASEEEETETYDLPIERAASLADGEPPTFDVARRLLDEAATLLRACSLQQGAPAQDVEPSLRGALQRIEHVRWIIGKGGSRG